MVDKNALVVNLYLILKLQSEEGRSTWMERPVVGSQGVDRRMEVIVCTSFSFSPSLLPAQASLSGIGATHDDT